MFTSEGTARFWSRVDIKGDNECWPWLRGKTTKGYGATRIDNVKTRAHRVAMMLHMGGPIPDGLHVLHHCDNPPCCNPRHLYLGTNDDNVRDKFTRNRQARNYGVASGCNKLTDDIVREMLHARVAGASFHELARRYDLDKKTVGMICRGQSWPHIPGTGGAPTLGELLRVPTDTRPSATLDEETVCKIMRRLADGEPAKPIAREFGVHFVTISDIKLGRSWAHLAGINGNPTLKAMRDAEPKSRFVAKLNENIARDIKRRLAMGESAKDIARVHAISPGAVQHIKKGRTWAHV